VVCEFAGSNAAFVRRVLNIRSEGNSSCKGARLHPDSRCRKIFEAGWLRSRLYISKKEACNNQHEYASQDDRQHDSVAVPVLIRQSQQDVKDGWCQRQLCWGIASLLEGTRVISDGEPSPFVRMLGIGAGHEDR
jgi:hypothetical protein